MTTMEHPSAMRRRGAGYVDNGAQFGNSFSTIEAPHIDPLDFNIDEDFSLVTWLYVPPGVNPIPLIDKRTSEGDEELGWFFACASGNRAASRLPTPTGPISHG